MNFLAFITLISFLIYICLGIIVYLKNTQNLLNRQFFIFSAITAYMCFTDFQVRIAESFKAALFWQRVGVIWFLMLPAWLHFVLVLVRPSQPKRFKWIYLSLYLSGGIFAFLDYFGGWVVDGPKPSPWGWSYGVTQKTLTGHIFTVWSAGLMVISLILCLRHYLKSIGFREKKQTQYILIGTSVPMAAGILELICSWLALEIPNLLEFSFAVGSGFWAYAIWKYELFILSPVAIVKEIIETMSDLLIVINPALEVKIVNQAALELFGLEQHELLDQPLRMIFDEADYRRIFEGSIPGQLTQQGFISDIEISARSCKGVPISISLTGTLIYDKNKQFQGVAFIGRDITKRKLQEEELRRYQESLEEIVAERTSELKKTYAQLQRVQKLEFMGTIAGGVAHDLNNILSGIVSYPELLLMGLPEESPLRKPMLTIQKSGEKAAAIVSDLLTLARREVSVKKVVNLNRVVQEYLQSPESLKIQSYYPDTRIVTHLDPTLMNILGSWVHLSKSLMNLVHNGIEAMASGGTLTIATENQKIDESIEGYEQIPPGSYVVLMVSDTGIGIASADIERIFEPFYTNKKMGQSGSGLGMAVVWGTVKDHSGYIDVLSREGKGTTFKLYFQATAAPEETTSASVQLAKFRGNGETVLVVDDLKEQREIAGSILKEMGYDVTTVSSGEEALAYLKRKDVDILVLDMVMNPGMDGLTTYQHILAFRPAQKVIISSGFSENERIDKVRALGIRTLIQKPYSIEKIGSALRKELDQ